MSDKPRKFYDEDEEIAWLNDELAGVSGELTNLKALVGQLLDMLETVEETSEREEFHPTQIHSCRTMHVQKLEEIMPKISAIVRGKVK